MAWAGKWVSGQLENLGFDLKNVMVTSCDADALLHPKYYSYLTYTFLNDNERYLREKLIQERITN